MRKIVVAVLSCLLVFDVSAVLAGTKSGDSEIGVQMSYQNMSAGDIDGDVMIIAGKFAYFLTDAISLGGTTAGVAFSSGDTDVTSVTLELEPNYHFNTASNVVPYAGVHTGMAIVDYGDGSNSEIDYGLQGGMKFFLSESTAFDTQLRFTRYSVDDTDVDVKEIRIGLNIYF